jgi:hypothetical protein
VGQLTTSVSNWEPGYISVAPLASVISSSATEQLSVVVWGGQLWPSLAASSAVFHE